MSYLDKTKMVKRLTKEFDIGYQGEKLRTIELVKKGEDRKLESIFEWMAPFADPPDLAAEMDEKIAENLDSNTEPVTVYEFKFRYGQSDRPRNGVFPVRVENERYHDSEVSSMVPMEGPSSKGLASQIQHAFQQYITATIGERNENQRVLRDILRDTQERLAESQRIQLETFRLQQDLLDRGQERNLALKSAERIESIKEQAIGVAMGMLPSILNQFMKGRDPEGNHAAERQASLSKAFILNLEPEERKLVVDQFVSGLGPRATPFLELLAEWSEEIGQHDAKRIAERNPSPGEAGAPSPPPGEAGQP